MPDISTDPIQIYLRKHAITTLTLTWALRITTFITMAGVTAFFALSLPDTFTYLYHHPISLNGSHINLDNATIFTAITSWVLPCVALSYGALIIYLSAWYCALLAYDEIYAWALPRLLPNADHLNIGKCPNHITLQPQTTN